jgi:phage tail-like protein
MAVSGKEQSKSTWPLAQFQFLVKIGDKEAFFQEVTGLSAEIQQIEYRAGNTKEYSTVKMPGIKKFGNITLKKGIFKDDKGFWDLYNKVVMNTFERKTITISLLDEKNGVAMSWILANAFPCKITVTDMKSDANEPAVETMEIAHEGLALA